MELAAHDARPVPTEVSRKQNQSKGPGASANPADVVLTTRAATQKQSTRLMTDAYSRLQKPKKTCHLPRKPADYINNTDYRLVFH